MDEIDEIEEQRRAVATILTPEVRGSDEEMDEDDDYWMTAQSPLKRTAEDKTDCATPAKQMMFESPGHYDNPYVPMEQTTEPINEPIMEPVVEPMMEEQEQTTEQPGAYGQVGFQTGLDPNAEQPMYNEEQMRWYNAETPPALLNPLDIYENPDVMARMANQQTIQPILFTGTMENVIPQYNFQHQQISPMPIIITGALNYEEEALEWFEPLQKPIPQNVDQPGPIDVEQPVTTAVDQPGAQEQIQPAVQISQQAAGPEVQNMHQPVPEQPAMHQSSPQIQIIPQIGPEIQVHQPESEPQIMGENSPEVQIIEPEPERQILHEPEPVPQRVDQPRSDHLIIHQPEPEIQIIDQRGPERQMVKLSLSETQVEHQPHIEPQRMDQTPPEPQRTEQPQPQTKPKEQPQPLPQRIEQPQSKPTPREQPQPVPQRMEQPQSTPNLQRYTEPQARDREEPAANRYSPSDVLRNMRLPAGILDDDDDDMEINPLTLKRCAIDEVALNPQPPKQPALQHPKRDDTPLKNSYRYRMMVEEMSEQLMASLKVVPEIIMGQNDGVVDETGERAWLSPASRRQPDDSGVDGLSPSASPMTTTSKEPADDDDPELGAIDWNASGKDISHPDQSFREQQREAIDLDEPVAVQLRTGIRVVRGPSDPIAREVGPRTRNVKFDVPDSPDSQWDSESENRNRSESGDENEDMVDKQSSGRVVLTPGVRAYDKPKKDLEDDMGQWWISSPDQKESPEVDVPRPVFPIAEPPQPPPKPPSSPEPEKTNLPSYAEIKRRLFLTGRSTRLHEALNEMIDETEFTKYVKGVAEESIRTEGLERTTLSAMKAKFYETALSKIDGESRRNMIDMIRDQMLDVAFMDKKEVPKEPPKPKTKFPSQTPAQTREEAEKAFRNMSPISKANKLVAILSARREMITNPSTARALAFVKAARNALEKKAQASTSPAEGSASSGCSSSRLSTEAPDSSRPSSSHGIWDMIGDVR